MKYAVFKDFSGGLNTSLDPTLIRLNQSPALANVDFADTGGFTRRKGYYPILDTPYSTPVKGAIRYYQLDGDIYWCFATATQMRVEGSAPPNGVVDAYAAKTSGTTFNATVSGAYAGANTYAYSVASATGAFSTLGFGATYNMTVIPLSTRLTLDSYRAQSASVSFNGGAWMSQSGTTAVSATLPSGSNSLSVKAAFKDRMLSHASSTTGYVAASYQLGTWSSLTYWYAWNSTYGSRGLVFKTNRGWCTQGLSLGAIGSPADSITVTRPSLFSWPPNFPADKDYFSNSDVSRLPTALIRIDLVKESGKIRLYTNGVQANYLVDTDGLYPSDISALGEVQMNGYLIGGVAHYATHNILRLLIDGVLASDCSATGNWSVATGSFAFVPAKVGSTYYKVATVAADKVLHDYTVTSGPTLSTLSATDDRVSLVQLNDKVFYGSASRAIRQFDGSVDSVVTSAPTALHMVEHKRRVFAVPGTDPAIVNYTVLDQPASWTGTGSGFFRLMGKDSGAECTGMVSWNDNLYYTSQSQLWYVNTNSTPSNWSAKLISKVHGCVAPRSLAAGNNGIVFLSADGVRSYGQFPGILSDDGSSVMRISEDITPTLDSVTNKSIAAGIVYNNRYWLSAALNGATYNNAILVADLGNITTERQPAWTMYTGISIAGFYVTRGDEYALYGWHPTNGEVYRLDYGDTDNGAAIATSYTLPPIAPTDYAGVVHFRYAHVSADADAPTPLTITPATDDVACAPVTLTVNEDSDRRPVRTPLNARGRSLSLTMSTDGTGQPITVSRVVIPYIPSPIR